MRNIILIAPPAAGKGTQAKLLAKECGYLHISTGDLLREAAKTNSFIANELSLGHFIDDDTTLKLLEEELKKDIYKKGYILDGFPRNLYQALKYDEILEKYGIDLGHIIVIDLTYEEALRRVLGRLTCSSCGAIYNETEPTMAPKIIGKCDKCNGDLYKRSDDNETSFVKRYESYKEKTEPVIKYYESKYKVNHIISININTTFNNILEIVESGD
jgi:adenylate kinase